MKKKFLIICIIILFGIIIYNLNKYHNYESISNYVNKNYKEFEEIAKECIKGNRIYYPRVIRSVYCREREFTDNIIVEFRTGASGSISNSTYYGFYYSVNDIPAVYQHSNYKLNKVSKNKWEWIGEGDNHGTTIKIRDNWYYFDVSY